MWLNRTASGVVGLFLLVIFIASCGSSDVQKAKEFIASGMYPQAIELLNKRIQAKPDDEEAHFNLGVCLLNTGDFRGADERFASAVRLKPDFGFQIGGEFKKAADVAIQEGNTNKAVGLYANALKYQPDLKEPIGNALAEKGKALADSGIDVQGIEIHRYAYSIFPSLGLELGKFYGDKAANTEQLADKAKFLRFATEFDNSYQAEFSKVGQLAAQEEAERRVANAKADLEEAMSADLETWSKAVTNASKYLSDEELLQYAGKYFEKQYGGISPFELNPIDGWKKIANVENNQKIYYIANGDFFMKDSVWKRVITCQGTLIKPKTATAKGGDSIDIFIKTDKIVSGYFWIE